MTNSAIHKLLGGYQGFIYDFPLKWPDALKQNISPGGPLFLRLVHLVSPSYRLLPWIEWGLVLIALLYLLVVIQEVCNIRGRLSFAIITCFIFAPIYRWHPHEVWPYDWGSLERIAYPFLITSFASILGGTPLVASAAVFLSCLIRPAYLALVPFAVIMRPHFRMAAAVCLPIAAWICFRGWAVGDYAFASDGAHQAICIYGPMITRADINGPLAQEIYDYREKQPVMCDPFFLERKSDIDYYANRRIGFWMQNPDNVHVDGSPMEVNAQYRRLWPIILRRHWKERAMLYYRSWCVAVGKWPDMFVNLPLLLMIGVKYAASI